MIEPSIRRAMEIYPAVTLFGPRQCGKTTLARSMFSGFSYANLEESRTRELASSDPNEFFHVYQKKIENTPYLYIMEMNRMGYFN